MAGDLGSIIALKAAWQAAINNTVPDESIEPDDHYDLFESFVDTCIGLGLSLRADPNTGGYSIEVTDGDVIFLNNGGFKGAITKEPLTGNHTWTFPDKTGVVAMLSDIGTPNATHTGDATGATALTLQPVAITGKSAAAALTGTEAVLIEQGAALVKTTTQGIADLVSADSIYTADGTLLGARVVTMGANTLTFEGGHVIIKGENNTYNGLNFTCRGLSGADVFKVSNRGLISTLGDLISFQSNTTHAIRGDTATANRGVIGFYNLSGVIAAGIGTSGIGINREPVVDTALSTSMKVIGSGFLFSDELNGTYMYHQNINGGNRFAFDRSLSAGSALTDGIINIGASRANAASIKLDTGVDPIGTNLTSGAIWHTASRIKVQAGADTIQLYAQDNTVAAATLVGGGGTALTDTDTFGGFTLQQLAQLLLNNGLAK